MKVREILSEAAQPKYYTAGDELAIAIAASGGWQTFAKAGTTSTNFDSSIFGKIPKGSVVSLSLGANDATTDTPEQIASRIEQIVLAALTTGLGPLVVLFPSNGDARRVAVRTAIRRIIRTPFVDLEKSSNYKAVAAAIVDQIKPSDPASNPSTAGVSPVGVKLLQDPAFMGKLEKISNELGVKSTDLIAIMKQECGLDPHAMNKSSNAVGLIQFIPSTASSLGTSTRALSTMSAIDQLDYVLKYFKAAGVQPGMGLGDLYIAVFYPKAMGKNDNYVISRKGNMIYNQNAGLDRNGDQTLTVADVKNSVSRFA